MQSKARFDHLRPMQHLRYLTTSSPVQYNYPRNISEKPSPNIKTASFRSLPHLSLSRQGVLTISSFSTKIVFANSPQYFQCSHFATFAKKPRPNKANPSVASSSEFPKRRRFIPKKGRPYPNEAPSLDSDVRQVTEAKPIMYKKKLHKEHTIDKLRAMFFPKTSKSERGHIKTDSGSPRSAEGNNLDEQPQVEGEELGEGSVDNNSDPNNNYRLKRKKPTSRPEPIDIPKDKYGKPDLALINKRVRPDLFVLSLLNKDNYIYSPSYSYSFSYNFIFILLFIA